VDTEKAVRRGISVDAINQALAMAMGGFKVGDVKRGTVQEPTYIVLQVPLANRAELNTLGSLPIRSPSGETIPLSELGQFVKRLEDPIIYHKDLRPMEYVVGEMEGRLGAPIYGMLEVEELLRDYTTPDGVQMTGMPGGLIGPPPDDAESGFEWSGEWTVTYETFRDMGVAFIAALLLIYGLIVWEFRDFALAGLIMSPIPLTLIGIIPGHLVMGAEFTATSMIGLIALGGIIVRQSILIVEFVKIEVAKGKSVREAAVDGAEIRMRPILITSLTLMAGAWAIIQDPIFQGMAVSLFFGAGVATLMAVIVIPLGCISLRKHFYLLEAESGEIELSGRYAEVEGAPIEQPGASSMRTPLWVSLWSGLVAAVIWLLGILSRLGAVIWRALLALFGRVPPEDDDGSGPASGGGGPTGSGTGARAVSGARRHDPAAASTSAAARGWEQSAAPTPASLVSPAAPVKSEQADTSAAPAPPVPARAATKKAAAKKGTTKKGTTKQAAAKKTAAAKKAAATKKTTVRKTSSVKKTGATRKRSANKTGAAASSDTSGKSEGQVQGGARPTSSSRPPSSQ
jgi:hypothetical protein